MAAVVKQLLLAYHQQHQSHWATFHLKSLCFQWKDVWPGRVYASTWCSVHSSCSGKLGLQALGVSCSVVTSTKAVLSAQAEWM